MKQAVFTKVIEAVSISMIRTRPKRLKATYQSNSKLFSAVFSPKQKGGQLVPVHTL